MSTPNSTGLSRAPTARPSRPTWRRCASSPASPQQLPLSQRLTSLLRLRLFHPLLRIQGSMSAQAFTLTFSRFPVLFAGLMTDDKQTIALGLRRRDPDVLDQLIEQYQHRLFAISFFSPAIPRWPKTSSRKPGFASWNAATSTTPNPIRVLAVRDCAEFGD